MSSLVKSSIFMERVLLQNISIITVLLMLWKTCTQIYPVLFLALVFSSSIHPKINFVKSSPFNRTHESWYWSSITDPYHLNISGTKYNAHRKCKWTNNVHFLLHLAYHACNCHKIVLVLDTPNYLLCVLRFTVTNDIYFRETCPSCNSIAG